MDIHALIGHDAQWWWILPLLVFVARVMDVSLGTLRIMFVSRGLKILAPIVGFCEVFIWIVAVAQVVRNADNIICYLAYATGFGLGTYVGLMIEGRLALGTLILRIITQQGGAALVTELRRRNLGVTCIDAEGSEGAVKIIFAVIRRTDLRHVLEAVQRFNPKAFYTIEDVRAVNRVAFPFKVS
jgi:uncharacterized protein YebE (UPF0316 family)